MRSIPASFVLAALLFVGAGCALFGSTETNVGSSPPGDATGEIAAEQVDVAIANVPAVAQGPSYREYSAEALVQARAARRPVLLYFWAAWCPICRAEEPKLKAMIEGSSLNVAAFRVNFDEEKELKAKYRVPYQHTTIIFDADGNESARFTGPVAEAELTAALAAAAQ